MHSPNKVLSCRKGFTLIELLVVIAIIALLLSIITPALRKAKQAAMGITCRSNMRQMGVGLSTYYVENGDKALYSDGGEDFWFLQIAPYLGETRMTSGGIAENELRATMEILKCPMTKAPESTEDTVFGMARQQYRYSFGRAQGSYSLNAWVGGWDFKINSERGNVNDAQAKVNLNKSFREKNANRNRADVPAVADGLWVDTYPEDTDKTPDAWPADAKISEQGNFYGDIGLGRLVTDRHGINTNILFCDGHVEPVKLEALWAQQWHKEFKKNYDVVISTRP